MKKAGRIVRRLSMILSVVMLLTTFPVGMNFALAASIPKITYQVHIQSKGWLPAVTGGKTAGSTGKELRMEALKINLAKNGKSMIQYNAHVATIGWQGWKKSGQVAGTTGKSKAIEAVKIKLVGDYAKQYDIYYRLHVAYRGWLGWAKNGAISGSTGMALRAEAIQIKLVKKGTTVPTEGKTKLEVPKVQYRAYSQNSRWGKYVGWNQIAGTVGEGKRMEALTIKLKDFDGKNGIKYRAHVSKVGWQGWKRSGEMAGTTGRSLAIEAVQIKLDTGLEKFFDIYYRLHVTQMGWLGWTKNGEIAGTTGRSLRSEAIQICLVNKDGAFDRGGPAYYSGDTLTAHTADEAINWCYSLLGSTVGGGECVDFVKAYYQYLGVEAVWGDGKDYSWNPLPAGWTRVQGGIPKKGDILVYGPSDSNGYGHVGIYESERSTFHQNVGGRFVTRQTYRFDGFTNPYWGYIRPDFRN